MEGDIAQMGQFIGAGLAAIGSGAAAIGVGHVAGNFLAGALRNPSAAAGQTATSSSASHSPKRWASLPSSSRFC
jgi:F-type H+-transporting ATPase subunit c